MNRKIEVGKTYRTREGRTVTIVEDDGSGFMQFKGDNDFWYTDDGRVLTRGPEGNPPSVDWGPKGPAFSPAQVSRLMDALNLARGGCGDTAWEKALVALEEALCPKEEPK